MKVHTPLVKNLLIIALLLLIALGMIAGLSSVRKPMTLENVDQLYLARSAPGSYALAVKKSAPAVVSIQTTNSKTLQQGLGSGVIVDKHGHILTNNHVIENSQDIIVKLGDGRSAVAQIIGADQQTDLAILQIKLINLPVINLGNSTKAQVGDVVLAIGNPYGLSNTVTQGIISAIGSVPEISLAPQEFGELIDSLIQTDAAINLGNSGGALTDTYGNVIGINTAIMASITGSQGIGFAIPIDKAKDVMQQIIANGSVTRGWIGTQLSELPAETKQYLHYNEQDGIYVQDTLRNSPAQKAGILPGDILVKVNNLPAQNILKTIRVISALTPDKTYNLEVFRKGEKIVYPVTVEKRPT